VSGTVSVNSLPLANVTLAAANGGVCSPSNALGQYSCAVPPGWSGTVTPSATGYSFAPASRSLTSVGADQSAQDFAATLTSASAPMFFVHVDHLNTPRLIADSTGATVWRNDNTEPFGDSVPDENPSGLGAFEFPLRFAGTYQDRETSGLYNYFRDLDVSLGRYRQSDPIGLRAGLNTYAHVLSNPLSLSDPRGLAVVCIRLFGRMVCTGTPDPANGGAQPGGANPPSGGDVIPFPGGRDRPTDRPDRPDRSDGKSCPAPEHDRICPFTGLATFEPTGTYSYELSCQYSCPRKGIKYLKTTVYFPSGNPAFLCDPAVPEYYFP
jgi:RHS repeat-associated protein